MQTEREPGPAGVRQDGVVAGALALGFLLLYLRTLCPTVYLGDAGEISTAIATGGVVHPPGYPLFSLLGRAALVLVPCGEPAFRLGCLVAAAAATTVGALYLLARHLDCGRWAAAAGAATLGAGYTFWSQSTRVEVYSFHALLVCLAFLGGLQSRHSGRLRYLAVAALAGSFGLAHHLTIVLMAPAVLAICGPRLWRDPGLGRRLLLTTGLLAAGPSLYALLAVWASAEPLQAWGYPVNLPLLWNHASARLYQRGLQFPVGALLLRELRQTAAFYVDNFPSLLALLPLVGGWVLWRRDRALAAGLLLGIAVAGVFNLCYQVDDIAPYYIPIWLLGAALLAVALDAVLRRLARPRARQTGGALLFSGLLAALVLRNIATCDLSRATWVREFARQKLESADPRAILVTQEDADVFPIWYVQDLLHVRPDVLLVDRILTRAAWSRYDRDPSQWYLRRLRREGVDVSLEVPRDPAARARLANDGCLIGLLTGPLRGRPLCTTFFATAGRRKRPFLSWASERYVVLPQGIVLRLQPKRQPVDLAGLLRRNERLWNAISLPELRDIRTDQEMAPDYVVNHYACMLVNLGGLHEAAGDRAHAEALYCRAAEWAPRYRPAAAALAALRHSARAQSRLPSARS
jgi:hypothetical protein